MNYAVIGLSILNIIMVIFYVRKNNCLTEMVESTGITIELAEMLAEEFEMIEKSVIRDPTMQKKMLKGSRICKEIREIGEVYRGCFYE